MLLFEKKTARIAGDQAKFALEQQLRERELAVALRDGASLSDEPIYGQETPLFLKGTGRLFPAGIAEETGDEVETLRKQVTP